MSPRSTRFNPTSPSSAYDYCEGNNSSSSFGVVDDDLSTGVVGLPGTTTNVRCAANRTDNALEDHRTCRPPEPFPIPRLSKAARDVTVTVYDWMGSSFKREKIWLMRNETKASKVYRKLSYPKPIPIQDKNQHIGLPPKGWIIFCLALPRSTDPQCSGYQEPRPGQEQIVAVKKFMNRRTHNIAITGIGESPLKEVSVLQELGHDSATSSEHGVFECLEALEDAANQKIYLVCNVTQYRPLETSFIQPPCWNVGGCSGLRNQQEEKVKQVFQMLLKKLHRLHSRGIAHRTLSPASILWYEDKELHPQSSSQLIVDDFTWSLRIPRGREAEGRILITPQGTCGMKEYMAPEVYFNRPFDGLKADVWSCGVTLFNMLTGCRLYDIPSSHDRKFAFFVVHGGISSNSALSELLLEQWFAHSSLESGSTTSESSTGSNTTYSGLNDILQIVQALEFLSPEPRDLLTQMLQVDPQLRNSVSELLQHSWFQNGHRYSY